MVRHLFGILQHRLGIYHHQRAHDIRMNQRAAQRQIAALRHAHQHRLVHAQKFEQRRQIVRTVVIAERRAVFGVSRLAMTTLIPADAAKLPLQGFNLRIEHAAVHQQPMREHNHRAAPTRVFVINVLAIDWGKRHVRTPCDSWMETGRASP